MKEYLSIDKIERVPSGWVAELDVITKNCTRYQVFLPDSWSDHQDLCMYVCAYAGYYHANEGYGDFREAEYVAEKVWKFGDLALRYLIEIQAHDSLDELKEVISRLDGEVSLLPDDNEEW